MSDDLCWAACRASVHDALEFRLPERLNDDVRIGDHDRIEIRSSPCHVTQEDVDYVDGRRLRDKPKRDSPAADLSLHR